MGVRIFTDAGSNLFASYLKENDLAIYVLPMPLQIGGESYLCYEDSIDAEKLSAHIYAEMKQGKAVKTSLPSPGRLEEKAREEIEKGNQVVFVSLSSGISGSCQSGRLIASALNEEKGRDVMATIDSKTAGFGEGMVAIYAEKLVKQGLPFAEIVAKTTEYVERVRSEFTVDTLKYLAATGRISNLKAVLAGALMIKPLLYGSEEGKIVVTSKVVGRKAAIKRLVQQVVGNIKDKTSKVYIAHAAAKEDAESMKESLKEKGIENVEIAFYDLITGAHVGPGTLAVFYEGENREVKRSLL
mgnify:CR=1 FL=1